MRVVSLRAAVARVFARRYPFRHGMIFFAHRIGALAELPPDGTWVRSREGLWFRVRRDRMYSLLYGAGAYEPDETMLIKRLLRPGDTVIDVGANFGWYTVLFGHLVGPQGRVVAFEPVPQFYSDALAAVARNDLSDRICLLELAVGDHRGTITIHVFDGLPSGHASASDLGRDDATPYQCDLAPLDELLSQTEVDGVDLIKIDVEGHESFVFRGARDLLEDRHAPMIFFEGNPEPLAAQGSTVQQLFEELRAFGYDRFFRVRRGGWLTEEHIELRRLTGSQNYLAVKAGKLERITPLLGSLRFP